MQLLVYMGCCGCDYSTDKTENFEDLQVLALLQELARAIVSWQWDANTSITVLDIIHPPASYLELNSTL
jgi:hypothetical protein